MEEIRDFAGKQDALKIKELWDECFPQFGNYTDFFMERIYKPECARLLCAEGELLGMIHVFPRTFTLGGEEFSAKYIFGVGTAKKMRGHGIAGKLLSREEKDCDFLTLIPQDAGLFEFYKKKGFSIVTYVREELVAPGGKAASSPAGAADIPKLNGLYEKMCGEALFPKRTPEDWRTLLAEYKFLNGGFLLFEGGYLAYSPGEEIVYVDEFFSENPKIPDPSGIFEKPCKMRTLGRGKSLAVIKPVSEKGKKLFEKEKPCYINLMHN